MRDCSPSHNRRLCSELESHRRHQYRRGLYAGERSTITGDTVPQSCPDIFSGAAVPVTPDNFATVMSSTSKVSNSQSLFVSPSLVTGLYTQTENEEQSGQRRIDGNCLGRRLSARCHHQPSDRRRADRISGSGVQS